MLKGLLKFILTVLVAMSLCAVAFAEDEDKIAKDYQNLFGGDNATVEFNDPDVVCVVAKLKIDQENKCVTLPQGLKQYSVARAGRDEAYLIIPHYDRTRLTVMRSGSDEVVKSLKNDYEGRSLILFCDAGSVYLNILTRKEGSSRVMKFTPNYTPVAGPEENTEKIVIPEDQEKFIKDLTGKISADGRRIYVKYSLIKDIKERF